jgi:hypothetical protein
MGFDPIDVALEVARILERVHVPYVLGGSLASTLHGEPRATLDVDFAVQLQLQAVEQLASALKPDFYVQPEAMRDAVARHSMFNVIRRGCMLKVDMHVRPAEGIYAEEIRRASRLRLRRDPEEYAAVATPEDTILQKLRWYRLGDCASDRQWRDVLGILKVQGNDLDREYMARWSLSLGVDELLGRAIAQAGGGRPAGP